jgi:putative inorganic carbon (hco3(-)) transporter
VFLACASLIQIITGADLGSFAQVETSQIIGEQDGTRVAGAIGESNLFAQVLVPTLVLALYRAWAEPTRFARLAALSAASLIGVVVTLTYSRGGLVALLMALAVALVMQRSRPRRWLVVGLVLVLVTIAAPRAYWDRMDTLLRYPFDPAGTDASLQLHANLWQAGALMFLEHPITGVGKGNYAGAYETYGPRVGAPTPGPMGAHNVLVRIAAETGLLGAAAWTAAVAIGLIGIERAKRRVAASGEIRAALLLEGVEVALCGLLVAGLFLDDSFPRYLWALVALTVIGRRVAALPAPEPDQPKLALQTKRLAIAASPRTVH